MADVAPAPGEVEKDGQVLKHTTAPEHRTRKRRIMRPREPVAEPEATAEPESAAEPKTDEPTDRMRQIVERHAKDDEGNDAPAPKVTFVNESGESLEEDDEDDDQPPPMEPRHARRTTNSETDIVLTDEPVTPRTLEDLSGIDFGDQYYVQVIRKEPKVHNTKRVDGLQKEIRRRLSVAEFARIYGGLTYELTLYGPPKKGPVFDAEGKPVYRPRSKPFTVTVAGQPPNPRTCVGYDEEDDDDMAATENHGRPRAGIATNADARIHESDLEHERHMQERREERERQRQARQREQETERRREEGGMADAFARIHASSTQAQNEMYQMLTSSQTDMIRQLAGGRQGAGPEEQRYLHETITRIQEANQDYVNKLNDTHSAQLERVSSQHRAELERLDTQHRGEISRLQDQVVAERTRSETIVRDAERNFNDRVREVEKRAEKEVSDARRDVAERLDATRRDFDTRLADINQRHADRHQDLKDNHERDLKSRDGKWEMQIASERSAFDSRMAVKDHELKLLREESARLREENSKPIHERVREITETAEALGMRRAEDVAGSENDEPQNWQQILFRMGSGVIENLPQIMSSAGETIAKLRSGGTPAQQAAFVRHQQVQMREAAQTHPVRGAPMPFAIDGEDDFQSLTAAPVVRGPLLPEQPIPAPQPVQQQLPLEAAPLVNTMGAPAPSVAPAAPTPSAAPPAPSIPPPASAQPAEPSPAMDPYILQYREPFEQAMAANATPHDLAAHLLKTFPPAAINTIIPMLSAEVIRTVLQRNGQQGSPLCRREGQKYLRALKVEIEAQLRAQP